jgi:hypothetical protein
MIRPRGIVLVSLFLIASCGIALAADSAESKGKKDLVGVMDFPNPSTYIWTDKVVYTSGQSVELMLHQDPNGNPFAMSYLVYRENLQTGEKLYHPNYTTEVTDMFGLQPNTTVPSPNWPVYAVPKLENFVIFGSGGLLGGAQAVPSQPGSYRYVMELRDSLGRTVGS